MNDYLLSLGRNDDMTLEWEQMKSTTLKFDPTYNYYSDLLSYEIQENKRSADPISETEFPGFLQERIFNFKYSPKLENIKCEKICGSNYWQGTCPLCHRVESYFQNVGGGEAHCRNVECRRPLTPEEMKQRVYKEWLYHKYKHFKKNWKPKSDDGLGYMWLTINFAPEVKLNDAILHASSIFSLKILSRSKITYCYEFNTSQGQHIHIHALIELNHTGKVSFSSLKDDILKAKSRQGKLNIYLKMSWAKKYCDRCDNRAKYQAYLNGDKQEEKLENVELDKLWRRENNLEDLYIKENK